MAAGAIGELIVGNVFAYTVFFTFAGYCGCLGVYATPSSRADRSSLTCRARFCQRLQCQLWCCRNDNSHGCSGCSCSRRQVGLRMMLHYIRKTKLTYCVLIFS